ncbi:MAG: RNA polymerase sigma-70 factor [Saprospiraceae bacterium]|nr:RNA polymerase sigma-70 factor [Saprospiraceae bacterium]
MKTYDDPELPQALRRGDEAAFDALFRALYAPLCRYATGMCDGDPDLAEDLVQQAFVKLWEQRAQIDVRHSLRAYLYKMVHHQALNRLRHLRTRERYQNEQLRHPEEATQLADPDLSRKIHQALETLPPQCRQIFELSRFEELKYREIAELLQLSVKTVETQMGKALRLMRLHLADYLALGFLLFCQFAQWKAVCEYL